MAPTRRTLLRASGTAAAALLAGCESLLGDGESTPTPSPTNSPPRTTQPGTPTDVEALRSTAEAVLADLAANDFGAARDAFAPAVRGQIPAETLDEVWSQLTRAYGRYVGIAEVEHSTQEGRDVLTVVGQFEAGRQRFRFVFDERGLVGFFVPPGGAEGAWEPPAYADESALTEREIQLRATDDCSLGATLTMPTGEGSVPGVVVVHGSGPADRDLTVGPNKPYKDLAWGLASRGIAVLRYDKRTAACDVDLASATIDDVVTDDALTALARLREVDRVRADDLVLVGHSIGGTLAPRIAARDGNLAGAAMLAPLGRSVQQAMLDQNRYLAELDGEVTEAEQRQLDQVEAMVEQIRLLDIADDEVVYLGGRAYWRTLTEYDQLAAAADLELPLYLAFGGRDYQVTVDDDRPLWRDALEGDADVTFATYPDLNHLFLAGSGQPTPSEYFEPANVDRAVVTDLAGWIEAVAGA
jgi:dienelactone hydrolase